MFSTTSTTSTISAASTEILDSAGIRTNQAVIEDPRHPAVSRIADLLRSRSPKPRRILIDEEENIAQAVRAGISLLAVYCSEDQRERAAALAGVGPETEVHALSGEVLRTLFTGVKGARVFAIARAPKPAAWDALAGARGDVLVLDGVRIPGNIGAIIRTARAFDAAGVILLDSHLTSMCDRRLIRASRGLVFTLPVLLASRDEVLAFLRAEALPLASMTTVGASSSSEIGEIGEIREIGAAGERIAILLGSERSGSSRELEAHATLHFAVPMAPDVESLNVSVAAGIALYERLRDAGG